MKVQDGTWETAPLTSLRGVGKAREEAYARLHIHTLGELLAHYPRAYENRGAVRPLSETTPDEKCATVLTVATEPRVSMIRHGKTRMTLLKFRAFDESASCEITYFNQEYLKSQFSPGAVFRFYGKVEKVGNRYFMGAPACERVPVGGEGTLPALIPVYRLTPGLSQKQVSEHMRAALRLYATSSADDPLPSTLRTPRGLCVLSYALQQIHCPQSVEALTVAKRRLIYDEFFLFALGLAASRKRARDKSAPVCGNGDPSPLLARLPYALTGAQRTAIEDIRADMARGVPMRRMVIGDVGCGKTVVAAAAMLFAVQSGRQAALMAPTEILARQHAAELEKWFSPLGIRTELLIGTTPAARKRAIKAALASSDRTARLPIVVGTQALLVEGVEFFAPGLIVTDEQHRFGVEQRALLSEKGQSAHVLVMSATPIPRSLALGLYGDLDISYIHEMPPGRQCVETYVVDESYRDRLCTFISAQVHDGGQVYVVCPAISAEKEDESEGAGNAGASGNLTDAEEDAWEQGVPLSAFSVRQGASAPLQEAVAPQRKVRLLSAIEHTQTLRERLPGVSVDCLHGKMKPTEKDAIMRRFVSGETQVLVSTTVIEVGVNVPNACLMVIENAERFGLSQLHQLRGRVGRGKRKSYCVLVRGDAAEGESARRRLEIMRREHDGFAIAKQDLALRGPGDFLRGQEDGIRQSGGVQFRLADQCDDESLMQEAMEDARELLGADADLSCHSGLRRRMEALFSIDPDVLN